MNFKNVFLILVITLLILITFLNIKIFAAGPGHGCRPYMCADLAHVYCMDYCINTYQEGCAGVAELGDWCCGYSFCCSAWEFLCENRARIKPWGCIEYSFDCEDWEFKNVRSLKLNSNYRGRDEGFE
jgi:hypothetical protein